jgi:hypothetical protein
MELNEVYRFYRDHAGYVVGEHAKYALKTVKRALLAETLGLEVTWEYEQGDWMEFAGDPIDEYRTKFAQGTWECFHAYIKDDSGNYLASLSGIILGRDSDADRRVYELELLSEALTEILKTDSAS